MTDDAKDLRGLDPRKEFYLNILQGFSDGSMELDTNEGGFATLDEAIEAATESIEDNGGEIFIYTCKPLKRVRRHRVKIDDLP